ncbi:hypothetical protein ACHAW5_001249 [Stephanodiscus triporus]|uniref:Uncharacterized protein n=1 Tax=Stephanodiscus triporus TaxID=2934178 RepID=A0ABD3N065_9STRA
MYKYLIVTICLFQLTAIPDTLIANISAPTIVYLSSAMFITLKYVGRITNFRNPIWLSGFLTVFRSHPGEIGNPNSFSASPAERKHTKACQLDLITVR